MMVNFSEICIIFFSIVKCGFCDKTYTTKSNLNRHLNVCSNKLMKEMEERMRKEMEERMKEEMIKFKEENKQLQIIQTNSIDNNNKIETDIKKESFSCSLASKHPPTVELRKSVWKLFIGNKIESKCICCGERDISLLGEWECGHICASSMGGSTDIHNLRPICGSCNRSMGKENMKTYMEKTGRNKSNPSGYRSLCVMWLTPDEYKNAMTGELLHDQESPPRGDGEDKAFPGLASPNQKEDLKKDAMKIVT